MEPKVRFKGFKGEWKAPSIGDVFELRNGYTPSKIVKEFWEGGTIPWFRMEDIRMNGGFLKDAQQHITPLAVKGAGLFEKKSIILATTATIGVHAMLIADSLANQQFTNFKVRKSLSDEYIDEFIYYSFFKIDEWSKNNTNSGGLLSVNMPLLVKQGFLTPCKIEQQAIASYFRILDANLQASAKKVESLKKLKSASLVAMFPQQGESMPKVRFKGFEGEWSKVELCSISKKVTNRNMDMQYTTTLTNSAEHGIIDQLAFFDHQVSNNDNISGYYVVENGDFVYNPRISALAPVGPINQNQIGYTGVMSPLYYVFRVDGVDTDYLSYYFKTTLWHQYLKDVGNSGARFDRLAITDSDFQKMPIYLPTNREEQQAIATFFRSLDRKIALETARLEKLKQIKLACLDKMFV